MSYYEGVAGVQLAIEFYGELRSFFQRANQSPESYGILERDLWRVNLERFRLWFSLVLDLSHSHRGFSPVVGIRTVKMWNRF